MATVNLQDELPFYVAFSHAPTIGPRSFRKLQQKYKSIAQAYQQPRKRLEKLLGKKLEKFDNFRKKFRPYKVCGDLINKNIQILCLGLSKEVEKFRIFSDFPICLYALGDTSLLTSARLPIAIIGTRKPTQYGREMTQFFSDELARTNTIVVSGLALGIDGCAHKASLGAHGKTIAVLGSGVTDVYPSVHLGLYNDIISSDGLVLSEYPPSTPAYAGNFVARNRIIAMLSSIVLIIEGNKRSGTLITGRYAAEYGKDVCALPGRANSPLSQAPHRLIQEGACLVTSPQDIIDRYGLVPTHTSGINKTLTSILAERRSSPQELADSTSLSVAQLMQHITELEMLGIVHRHPDDTYSVLQ